MFKSTAQKRVWWLLLGSLNATNSIEMNPNISLWNRLFATVFTRFSMSISFKLFWGMVYAPVV